MLISFKDSDFETKVKNEEVSIIQFSASWCAPCRVVKPIMEKLSDEFKNIKFFYADIDEDAINTASSAAVRGVPTIVIYRKGVETSRKVGGDSEQNLRAWLTEHTT